MIFFNLSFSSHTYTNFFSIEFYSGIFNLLAINIQKSSSKGIIAQNSYFLKIILYIHKSGMLDKVQKLKIAFVTDIHLHKNGLQLLSDWVNHHYNYENKFDYCLIGGDTANCHHDYNNHSEEDMFNSTVQFHKTIKGIFNCKTFFIPGNHDCKVFFHPNPNVQGFYTIHNKRLEITNGLDLVGFGGSTPGYVNGEFHWSGYPYANDEDLKKQWEKVDLLNQNYAYQNQVILLTHQGPALSETTLDRSQHPDKTVVTGSKFLDKFCYRKDIVCWIHGHTHQGSNNSKVGNVQIINPGPLKANKFMYFEVSKIQNLWKLTKKVFELL